MVNKYVETQNWAIQLCNFENVNLINCVILKDNYTNAT